MKATVPSVSAPVGMHVQTYSYSFLSNAFDSTLFVLSVNQRAFSCMSTKLSPSIILLTVTRALFGPGTGGSWVSRCCAGWRRESLPLHSSSGRTGCRSSGTGELSHSSATHRNVWRFFEERPSWLAQTGTHTHTRAQMRVKTQTQAHACTHTQPPTHSYTKHALPLHHTVHFSRYPNTSDAVDFGAGEWWWVGLTAGAGALIGVVSHIVSLPEFLDGFFTEVEDADVDCSVAPKACVEYG